MFILKNLLEASRSIVSREAPGTLPDKGLGEFHEPITQWSNLLWVEPERRFFRNKGLRSMTPNQTFAYYRRAFRNRYAKDKSVGYAPQELDELAKALHEPSPDLSATQLRQAVCQTLPALCGVVQGLVDIIVPDENAPDNLSRPKVRNTTDAEKMMGLLEHSAAILIASRLHLHTAAQSLVSNEKGLVAGVMKALDDVTTIVIFHTNAARKKLKSIGLLTTDEKSKEQDVSVRRRATDLIPGHETSRRKCRLG